MRRVWSSHIDGIDYVPEKQELHVQFSRGDLAVYHEVPHDVADSVMQSASIGKALHAHVRGKFRHSYPEKTS